MTEYNEYNEQSTDELICKNRFGTFFGVSQKTFDKVWSNLQSLQQNSVVYVSMEIGADPDVFDPIKNFLIRHKIFKSKNLLIQQAINKSLYGPGKIPNYSGGLGILAGDTLKSFADIHVPVVAVSLLYSKGYFSQLVDSKVGQIDQETQWNPGETPTLFLLQDPENPTKPLEITIIFQNEYDQYTEAKAQVWMKMEINEKLDYFIPEFLLDYNIPASPDWIREGAQRLYNSETPIMKANQRRMLGSGILPLLKALDLNAETIHLNEQHGVTVTLHLILNELQQTLGPDFQTKMSDTDILTAVDTVSHKIIYTIHTPVKAGHDRFSKSLYSGISHKTCRQILDLLAHDEDSPGEYNFTALAMRVNRAINSVSRLHRDVTRRQFPLFSEKITAITNGVHHTTWISDNRARVFDKYDFLNDWRHNPGCFTQAALMTHSDFRADLKLAWETDNRNLIHYINTMLIDHRNQMTETWIDPPNYLSHLREENKLQPGVFTIGFARRFSTYKRADLIFDNIPSLADILIKGGWPINFVFAGKAHPHDEPGKSVLKLILDNQEELYKRSNGLANLIFIPGYDMKIAKMMTSGVHAWLNNPKRPLEASGTSGMKSAMNGVPNISVMDGWWVEGFHDGSTGWKFGYEGPIAEANLSEDPATLLYTEDSHSFYQLLPSILDCFYAKPDQYIDKAVMNLQLNVPIFNTHRMAAEYVGKYNIKLDPVVEKNIEEFQKLYQSDHNNGKFSATNKS